jgi:hypothetical protein
MQHPVHEAYSYVNPNGSKYISNADGSKFYDPGPNKVGRKWYQSPDGVKQYLDEQPRHMPGYEEQSMAQYDDEEQRIYQAEVKYENDYDSEGTNPLFSAPGMALNEGADLVKVKQTARRTGGTPGQVSSPTKAKAVKVKTEPVKVKIESVKVKTEPGEPKSPTKAPSKTIKSSVKTPTKTPTKTFANMSIKTPTKTPKKTPTKTSTKAPTNTAIAAQLKALTETIAGLSSTSPEKTPAKSPTKPPKTPTKSPVKKSKTKEVHIHMHPRPAPPKTPPMNVTRVVHHSAKGDKEIVYRSPSKVTKDGKIAKAEKKVVHIHHHRR